MTVDYFIKDGYVANEALLTPDHESNGVYWNEKRLHSASYYQFGVYRLASKLIRERGVRRLVDVGCGCGAKLAWVHARNPEVEIFGIDQEHAVAHCRSEFDFGQWLVDDFEHPGEATRDVRGDLVICSDVIEHMQSPDLLLDYLKLRLADGGAILLSTPDRDLLRGVDCNNCPNAFHIREWNFEELELYLEDRGFEILEHVRQMPVRAGFSQTFYREVIQRALSRKPLRYNQVCLIRPR